MDINFKVKIEAPEIMAALLAIAEALPQMKLSTSKVKTIALEDVRAKLAYLSQAGKQKEVKDLIKKFGANKLTEVAEENYAQLLKEAEEIINGKSN